MRRPQRCLPPELLSLEPTLPDDWPGQRLGGSGYRHVHDEDGEMLMPGWVHPDRAIWTRVTLIGRNPWAVSATRHLLARVGTVRLRVMTDIPEHPDGLHSPDMVIWLREKNDGLPELAGYVVRVRRAMPAVRQLIISDAIPAGFTDVTCPLVGVRLLNSNYASIDRVQATLGRLFRTRTGPGLLQHGVLNYSQWRVLLLRAANLNTMTIAQVCGSSHKTVSVHESAIRERLGLANRVEYTWLMRAVIMVINELPGLAHRIDAFTREKR